MSKLKFEIVHFLVILVLLLLNVGGCGGQPLSSKFILKVKKQNPLPKEHVHITFLTPWIVFVGILGFQSLSRHYKRPCRILKSNYWLTNFLVCIPFIRHNLCRLRNKVRLTFLALASKSLLRWLQNMLQSCLLLNFL